jgi:hypothetical protein
MAGGMFPNTPPAIFVVNSSSSRIRRFLTHLWRQYDRKATTAAQVLRRNLPGVRHQCGAERDPETDRLNPK